MNTPKYEDVINLRICNGNVTTHAGDYAYRVSKHDVYHCPVAKGVHIHLFIPDSVPMPLFRVDGNYSKKDIDRTKGIKRAIKV